MKRHLVLVVLVFIAMAVMSAKVHAQQETEDQLASFDL
jgi:hypothetical protein